MDKIYIENINKFILHKQHLTEDSKTDDIVKINITDDRILDR